MSEISQISRYKSNTTSRSTKANCSKNALYERRQFKTQAITVARKHVAPTPNDNLIIPMKGTPSPVNPCTGTMHGFKPLHSYSF